MKKQDVVEAIILAKQKMNLTWEGIADSIGMSPVWTTSRRGRIRTPSRSDREGPSHNSIAMNDVPYSENSS